MKRTLAQVTPTLCIHDGCIRVKGHKGDHSRVPTEAWDFLGDRDKNKLDKAGYATPRGGAKGAYQNHVYRNGRVIIPYEKLASVGDLSRYKDGYVIRVFPEQCFSAARKLRPEFASGAVGTIGKDAFVLYRSHEGFAAYPPLKGWTVRAMVDRDGNKIETRRRDVVDTGHYVLRLPSVGGGKQNKASKEKRVEGPPQGIFAPEYADVETDYLCRVVLAWQIVHTVDSPYTTTQAAHLQSILERIGLHDYSFFERRGVMRRTFSTCPLCLKPIYYAELHEMLKLDDEAGLANAGDQVAGATRSTIVNLFHFHPLVYEQLEHIPPNVAWGHATCNTKLGQRRCYSLYELREMNNKVGVIHGEEVKTFGWVSDDWEMIRSDNGAVWIQITKDTDFSRYQFLNNND